MDELFNNTTHISLRWIYRSAKIDWTKKNPFHYIVPSPTSGVGTKNLGLFYFTRNSKTPYSFIFLQSIQLKSFKQTYVFGASQTTKTTLTQKLVLTIRWLNLLTSFNMMNSQKIINKTVVNFYLHCTFCYLTRVFKSFWCFVFLLFCTKKVWEIRVRSCQVCWKNGTPLNWSPKLQRFGEKVLVLESLLRN